MSSCSSLLGIFRQDGKMSLVARSKEKWLFSGATHTAVQKEREGELDPSGV